MSMTDLEPQLSGSSRPICPFPEATTTGSVLQFCFVLELYRHRLAVLSEYLLDCCLDPDISSVRDFRVPEEIRAAARPEENWLREETRLPNLEWLAFIRYGGFYVYWCSEIKDVVRRLLVRTFHPHFIEPDNLLPYQDLPLAFMGQREPDYDYHHVVALPIEGMSAWDITTTPSQEAVIASGNECWICKEEFVGCRPVETACGHIFGDTCLQSWLQGGQQNSETCPYCRADLGITDFKKLLPGHLSMLVQQWYDYVDEDRTDLEYSIDMFLMRGVAGEEEELFSPDEGEMLQHLADREATWKLEWARLFDWCYAYVEAYRMGDLDDFLESEQTVGPHGGVMTE
jgi:hypothetical protein